MKNAIDFTNQMARNSTSIYILVYVSLCLYRSILLTTEPLEKVYNYFGGGLPPPNLEKSPLEINDPLPKKKEEWMKFYFSEIANFPPHPQVPLEASSIQKSIIYLAF